MRKPFIVLLLMVLVFAAVVSYAPTTQAQDDDSDMSGTVLIDSWRNDDLGIWQDTIIPAFNEHYPNIEVTFAPSPPADYNGILNGKLEGGTAGDLITCRPFDASLDLFTAGHLDSLNDLAGLENFSDVAVSAWITDDGSDTFCVPMASVIHGFFYNVEAFEELDLEEPTTEAEFYAVLDAIQDDDFYAPLVMGTVDQWEAATMGWENIGPNYWAGEEGRLGLIDGSMSLNEGGFLAAFEALEKWRAYLPDGYEAIAYPDAQNMFTLGLGAIYPTGSWEISGFRADADFELGIFPPPIPEGSDTCYISDHTDIAMGLNSASENKEAATKFLEWMTTAEFAELYSNSLPGFFPLANHDVQLEDPIAQEFLSWRGECESTIRASYQILSRGEPNLESELWIVNALLLNGDLSPQEAADRVQDGLDAWYEPMASE